MIRIIVVRHSIGRADAVNNHAAEWEMPDDALIGEVLLRMHDDYLVRVNRSIAWEIHMPYKATVERDADGAVSGIGLTEGAFVNHIASLFVEPPSDAHPTGYTAISRWGSGAATLDLVSGHRHGTAQSGEYVFAARYNPDGRIRPLEQYRSDVAAR